MSTLLLNLVKSRLGFLELFPEEKTGSFDLEITIKPV